MSASPTTYPHMQHQRLYEAAYAASTIKGYRGAVLNFLSWTDETHTPTIDTYEQLDSLLTEYLHTMWYNRRTKSDAHRLYHGVILYLQHAKHQLPTSKLCLKGWNRLKPSVSYPPFTWEIAVLVAVQMTRSGWFPMAVGVLLSFHCYLRVGELVNIHFTDVADTGDYRLGRANHTMSIRLRKTKTGPNQWVTLTHPDVISLLRCLMQGIADSSLDPPLFRFSPARFRCCLRQSVCTLGLSHIHYVPHSLRHGGATHDFLSGVPLETVLAKGRWQSTKSARHYIQAGRSILLSTTVPQRQYDQALEFSQNIIKSLADAHQAFLSSSHPYAHAASH